MHRILPFVILLAALAGMVWFSRGLRVVDTAALLASGAIAGMALAEIVAPRKPRKAP